ncbi:unnamed protein product [Meloidogyne enterolobii]|uniref:Uncharacterized protein n=1 Tax=Meloidogyne enterolobii TaxID=390850 RepID=A0ACB0YKN4_MELEN
MVNLSFSLNFTQLFLTPFFSFSVIILLLIFPLNQVNFCLKYRADSDDIELTRMTSSSWAETNGTKIGP